MEKEVRVYTVFDTIAEEAAPLFFANNDKHAYRAYMQSMPQGLDPKDFELRMVGKFDLKSCEFFPYDDYTVVEELNIGEENG